MGTCATRHRAARCGEDRREIFGPGRYGTQARAATPRRISAAPEFPRRSPARRISGPDGKTWFVHGRSCLRERSARYSSSVWLADVSREAKTMHVVAVTPGARVVEGAVGSRYGPRIRRPCTVSPHRSDAGAVLPPRRFLYPRRAIAGIPFMCVIPAVCNPLPSIPDYVVEPEGIGWKRSSRGGVVVRSAWTTLTGHHAGAGPVPPIARCRRAASGGVFPLRLAGQAVGLTREFADPRDVLVDIGMGEVDHRPVAASPAVVIGHVCAPSGVNAEVPFPERHFILSDGEGIRDSHFGRRSLRLHHPLRLRRVPGIRPLVRASAHHELARRQFHHQRTFRAVTKLVKSGRGRDLRVDDCAGLP